MTSLSDSFSKLKLRESPPSLTIGKSYYLDNKEYKILKYLSYGAFKHVYIAEDKHDKKKVIIAENKSQHYTQLKEVHVFRRLKRELTKNNKLICNPRIICPIAIIEDGKYILTNYFDGTDLFELIDKYIKKRQFIPLKMVQTIMLNCAKALSELHSELHFIHLDIKPENIMINNDTGEIGLIDLGEGCFDDELEKCTLHKYKSTIGYISPEIMFDWKYIENDPKILRASDVYSLGCVFYELLYCRKVYGWIEESYDTDNGNFIEVLAYILDRINFEELYEVNKIRDAQQLRYYSNKYNIKTKERSIDVQFEEYENYSQFRMLDEIVNRMLDPDCETRITLSEVIETLVSYSEDSYSTFAGSAGRAEDNDSMKTPPLLESTEDTFDGSVGRSAEGTQFGGDGNEGDIFREIENKNFDKIRKIISLNPLRLYDFYKEADYKFTPIEWAVKNNCIECIEVILNAYEIYKADTIIRFNTDVRSLGQPIHFAVENGNIDMITYLIGHNFNINKLNKMGLTPLHLAIKKNKINVVYFLLRQSQIDKMKLDNDGRTPLELSLQLHHLQIATIIIRSGVKPNIELLNRIFKDDILVRDFLKEISIKLSRRKKTQVERKDRLDRILFYDYLCSNLNEAITPEIITGLSRELNTDIGKLSKKEICETLLKSIFFEKTLSEDY